MRHQRNTNFLSRREMLRRTSLAGLTLAAAHSPLYRLLAREETPELASLPEKGNELVRQYMREFDVPGFQLSYIRGSRLLYRGCFGEANRAEHEQVKPDSLFRIASCSKAFTSASIFLLIEAGKLKLTDHIFTPDGILPQYSNIGEHRDWIHAITVHDLLTHTGGGWSNKANDPMFEKPGFNHAELIEWTLKTHPLDDPPGTKYAYSNFGYCVLGRVIEKLSGERYAEFVHQHVLRPIGIFDMRIGTNKTAPNEVHYYGQGGANAYDSPIARMDSHGGWIATATNLAHFLACLFSPEDKEGAKSILTPESLKTMTTGTKANPGYACGLSVNKYGNAWHNGLLTGSMSLMVHTHGGVSWAAIINTSSRKSNAASRLDNMLWEIARTVPEWKV